MLYLCYQCNSQAERPDGARYRPCRACLARYARDRYAKNKEPRLKATAKWREGNPEGFKESCKKSYNKNKESIMRKKREYARIKRNTDLVFRIKANLRTRLYVAIKGGYKRGSAVADLGCTVEELRAYLESKFLPGMSWDNWGKGEGFWNIDHILPLAKVNLQDENEFKKVCHYTNLQPLWWRDNLIKADS